MIKSIRDNANWDGISLCSVNVGNQRSPFLFDGYRYINEEEMLVAQMLTAMGIPFTPDVTFDIRIPDDQRVGREKERKMFTPDFVFNMQGFIWVNGNEAEIIHGIEVKRAQSCRFPARARKYVTLLERQKGVVIKLLCRPQILEFYENMRLPIYRYRGNRPRKK